MIPYFSFEKIAIGPLTLYTWGIFVGLGAFTVFFLAKRNGVKQKLITEDAAFAMFLWIFVGLVIGARLFFVLQFPKEYLSHPLNIFKLWEGGMMSYGGIFGGLTAGLAYLQKHKVGRKTVLKIADTVALYLPLGFAIGRIANLLSNEHQGGITTLVWGIIWSDGYIRHPIALYLILSVFVIFFILQVLKSKLKKNGQLSLMFLLLYGLSRFLLDFLRSSGTELSNPQFLGIRNAQWISLGVFFFSAFALVWLQSNPPTGKKIVQRNKRNS